MSTFIFINIAFLHRDPLSNRNRGSDEKCRPLNPGGRGVAVKSKRVPIAEIAKRLVDIGVPVNGHRGLTPQSVHQLGGFRQQGRDSQAAEKLLKDADCWRKSGVFPLCSNHPDDLAGKVSSSLKIPTIGIGAGPQCDGSFVCNDAFGLTDGPVPPFAKQYAQLSS